MLMVRVLDVSFPAADFGLLGTGMMVERLKQGTSHSSRDLFEDLCKDGASWSARLLDRQVKYRLEAFLDFCFLKNHPLQRL